MTTPIFTQTQWEALLTSSISTINSLSKLKGGEYAGDVDRLANFRRNAEQCGTGMELIWSVYYNKHHDAVMQYVRDKQAGTTRERAEPLVGRVDDMIVYLLLLKAILAEEEPEEKFIEPKEAKIVQIIYRRGEQRRTVNENDFILRNELQNAGWLRA